MHDRVVPLLNGPADGDWWTRSVVGMAEEITFYQVKPRGMVPREPWAFWGAVVHVYVAGPDPYDPFRYEGMRDLRFTDLPQPLHLWPAIL